MMAGLITNGYLLSPKRILALNAAGLDFLQISIDNVEPDEVSKKSLRLLDKKLEWLRDHAHLRHQHQLGARRRHQEPGGRADHQPPRPRSSGSRPRSASSTTARAAQAARPGRARGLRRRDAGDQRQLADRQEPLLGIRGFQDNLVEGKPNGWRCRAGARYFYVCENGLVHYCSQQRGFPAVPLAPTRSPTSRASSSTPKSCAPYCTIGCVHRVSTMDFWRKPQDAGDRRPDSSAALETALLAVARARAMRRRSARQAHDRGRAATPGHARRAGTWRRSHAPTSPPPPAR